MTDHQTERLAGLLGEHWTAGMAANGAARKWECVCGERIAMSDAAHRAHVAAVLAEAGVGFVAEVERERDDLRLAMQADKARTVSRILYKQTVERAERAEELYRDASVRLDEQRKMTDEAEARVDAFMDRYEVLLADNSEVEAALADLRERVRALAEAWEHPVEGRALRLSAAPRLRALLDDGSAS